MRKIIYGLLLFILSGYLISCDSDMYSCDPLADAWVKDNLEEIKVMSRDSWLRLDENETVKRATYVAFKSESKRKFWGQKIKEVINGFSWTEKEKDHLNLLLDYVHETDVFDRKEVSEEFELFVYKWNDYAISELGWNRKLIYAIIANGNRLLDKDGNTESIPEDGIGQKRIKTNSEDGGEPDCSCSQLSDWCDVFGNTPPWVLSCNSRIYKCRRVNSCGALWQFTCDGICKPPI